MKAKGIDGLLISLLLLVLSIVYLPVFGRWWWPQLLDIKEKYNLDYWQFTLAFKFISNLVVFGSGNVIFYFIYHYEPKCLQKYKVQKEEFLWNTDPEEWKILRAKTARILFVNNFIVVPITLFLLLACNNFKVSYAFSMEELPDSFTLLWQIPFCIFFEDIGFTLVHRVLHYPFFYKHIHKIHHEYNMPIGVSGEHTHPIEFIFGNILPVVLPGIILQKKLHIFTAILFGSYRLTNTTLNHSGYDFPWLPLDLLPMKAPVYYHDYHHSKNQGNFSGLLTFWDTLFGNN